MDSMIMYHSIGAKARLVCRHMKKMPLAGRQFALFMLTVSVNKDNMRLCQLLIGDPRRGNQHPSLIIYTHVTCRPLIYP